MRERRSVSDYEKTVAIERAIEIMRRRIRPSGFDGSYIEALKSVARSVRAHSAEAADQAATEIGRKVAAVLAARAENRDEGPALRSLGEKVAKDWPTLQAALILQATKGIPK